MLFPSVLSFHRPPSSFPLLLASFFVPLPPEISRRVPRRKRRVAGGHPLSPVRFCPPLASRRREHTHASRVPEETLVFVSTGCSALLSLGSNGAVREREAGGRARAVRAHSRGPEKPRGARQGRVKGCGEVRPRENNIDGRKGACGCVRASLLAHRERNSPGVPGGTCRVSRCPRAEKACSSNNPGDGAQEWAMLSGEHSRP